MHKLNLLSTAVLANDPLLEWAGNHISESTLRKCFELNWIVVTHSEDRAGQVVDQVQNVPMDMSILVDDDARRKRQDSTLRALRSIPEGEWVWTLPEGAMVDVHSGSELLKLISASESPIAVERHLCRGLDHLVFRRPPDSVLESTSDAQSVFDNIRKGARSMECKDVYIARGASNDIEKLCIMYWTMKFWKHRYTEFYNKLLQPIRNQNSTLVEIGVAFGGSLRVWRDYLGSGSVVGLDIYPESSMEEHGIVALTGDSAKEDAISLVRDVVSDDVQVIVDDGDHQPQVQFETICNFWDILKKGGHYIIETAYGFEWLVPELGKRFKGSRVQVLDQRVHSGYGDSVLVHITKG
jgi:hypothetical protein